MEGKGWDVQLGDGALSAEVPDEQNEQFLSDHEKCVRVYGYDRTPKMNQEEAEEYYEELVTAGECLREEGFTTPDPASRQATIEALLNGQLPSWNPYDHVIADDGPGDDFARAYEACPPPW